MKYVSDRRNPGWFLTAMSLDIPITETALVTGDYNALEKRHGKHGPLTFRVLRDQTFPSCSYSV